MAGEVSGHGVHRCREIFPRSGNTGDVRLSTKTSFCSYLASYARYFAGEPVELVHHRVQRFFELQDFTANIDRDLARQIAAGNGSCDLCDVSHLASQVAGHEVHVIGEILPGTANAGHLRLPAQLAFRSDFAGDTRDFTGERIELIHHRVDGVFQFQNFTFNVDRDFARQITAGDGGRDFGDVS